MKEKKLKVRTDFPKEKYTTLMAESLPTLRMRLGLNQDELAELIGLKSVSKGVKVQFEDGRVVVDIIITVVYGCNIVNVAKAVQDKILSVVQATTGIETAEVNVHVSGIAFDK